MNGTNKTILLVEDNEDDVFMFRRVLKKALIANPVQVVTDGQQAIDYLSGTDGFSDRAKFPLPFLVFLDLKLPYRDGFEVLAWMRQQRSLNSVVVVILTGSDETRDHQQAYALGARSYLVKPPTPEEVRRLMDSMQSYWNREGTGGPVFNETRPASFPPGNGV
jgi:CheY-like chemotaxis protein